MFTFFTRDSIKLLLSTRQTNIGAFQFTIKIFTDNPTTCVFTINIYIIVKVISITVFLIFLLCSFLLKGLAKQFSLRFWHLFWISPVQSWYWIPSLFFGNQFVLSCFPPLFKTLRKQYRANGFSQSLQFPFIMLWLPHDQCHKFPNFIYLIDMYYLYNQYLHN